MHLYCDNQQDDYLKDLAIGHLHEEFPHEYVGPTENDCINQARKAGWLMSSKRQLCPRCNKKTKAAGED